MAYRRVEHPPEVDRSVLVVASKGSVHGLERESGAIRWTNRLRGGGGGDVTLAMRYGLILACADGPMLFCLEYSTGATRWSARTQETGRAAIVVESSHLVVSKGRSLDCFDHEGRLLWKQTIHGLGEAVCAHGYPGNVARASAADE